MLSRSSAIKALLVVGLAGAAIWPAYRAGQWVHLRAVLAAGRTPYTIIYRDAQFVKSALGQVDYTHEYSHLNYLKARRSDGSLSEITFGAYDERTGTNTIANRRVQSMADAAFITSFPKATAKTTMPLRAEELAAIKALPSDPTCITNNKLVKAPEYLGPGEYNGMPVVKHLFRSETAVSEIWSAPELDCELVYQKTEFLGRDGKPSDASIKSAVKVVKGEPESWIFASATGTEMLPSEALRAEREAIRKETGLPPTAGAMEENKNLAVKIKRRDDDYKRRWQSR